MRSIAALSVAVLLVMTGCTSPSPTSPTPSATASGSADASAAEPSTPSSPDASVAPSSDESTPADAVFFCNQAFDGDATSSDISHLADVRVGTHPDFDRIVFEYVEIGTPAYRLESASPPFVKDPSGMPLTVNGSQFMQLVFHGATKVGDDGNPTYAGATTFEPGFPQLVHLVEGGDFEAVNTWYIGLTNSPDGCFRAFQLADPARVVIDLHH